MLFFAGRRLRWTGHGVRTREDQEVALESYAQLQHDGRMQRAVREQMVAGLSTRNHRRAVESVLDGYETGKSGVRWRFVQESARQPQELCELRLGKLAFVALPIDGIHLGGQVPIVVMGIDEGGVKHELGLWQGATENTWVVKRLLEDLLERGLDA